MKFNLFKEQSIKGSQEVQLVEVEKGGRLPELTAEMKESLKSLQYHSGHNYLMQRLRYHKALLQKNLNEGLQLDEVQLRYLQAGLYWVGWLESEIKTLTQTPSSKPQPATPVEQEEFERLQAHLELVGA